MTDKQKYEKYGKKRRACGYCNDCKEKATPGRCRCVACAEKHRARERKRSAENGARVNMGGWGSRPGIVTDNERAEICQWIMEIAKGE